MAELFKNVYNELFFDQLLDGIKKVSPGFNSKSFLDNIYDEEWEGRELKQRMRHIAITLESHLAGNFEDQTEKILLIIREFRKDGIRESSLEYMIFPDFIELYGLEHYNVSVKAFEEITQFTSCEFAIRPFILRYEKEMVIQLSLWCQHENVHVRRLASEGCRPRLPWAMALPPFKDNPAPILLILEKLRADESEYVRRSVANNLNDIAKDNPSVVVDIAKRWQGESVEIDRLIKHACRTLLKDGNQEVMKLFGFGSIENVDLEDFKILTPTIGIGESVEFSFKLINRNKTESKVRLEYGLHYQKANGSLSRKVFKISERLYPGESATSIHRKQSFKLITTRKFHPGLHRLSIIMNGQEFDQLDFELIVT